MTSYLAEPWGRDTYPESTIVVRAETVEAAHAQVDRLVAKLTEQGIDPARFEWPVVDEDHKPVARLGGNRP